MSSGSLAAIAPVRPASRVPTRPGGEGLAARGWFNPSHAQARCGRFKHA